MAPQLSTFVEKYSKEGLSFFPIPFKSKQSDMKWEEYQHRLPTPQETKTWFNGHPTNIAVVCGKVSGNLVVLDCDSWERFCELDEVVIAKTGCSCLIDYTLVSKTAHGAHVWLRTKVPIKSQKYPKLDIKGEGGYIIVPPSIHPEGEEYVFLNDQPIREIESLESIGINIKQPSSNSPRNDPGWVTQLLNGVGEGQRNDSAIKLAGYFRNLLPVDITEKILLDWNSKNKPPMLLNELQLVIKSSYGYSPRTPLINNTLEYIDEITNGLRNPIPPIVPPFPLKLALSDIGSSETTGIKRNKSVTESVTRLSLAEQLALSDIGSSETTGINRNKSVTESVTESVTRLSLAEQIEEWVKDSTGWFSYEEIDKEFNIRTPNEKANRRNIIMRLKDGVIECHPKNNKLLRHINVTTRLIDLKASAKRVPLAIKYPFSIERYFNTYPGNIIALAGAADAGKTAFLLNIVKLNMYDFSIFYQSSEMGDAELYSRIEKFEAESPGEWNFVPEERSKDFADVIRPDCVNIIDYLELAGDFYSIADQLRAIHDKLATGIAIVALQKKRGAELGRGGDFGLEKPRLYLTMDSGKMTIQKAKNWVNQEHNPNGLVINFKIVGGCKFLVTQDWHKEEEDGRI
jgi:hypothetical protein